ncbi:DUF1614 domain-containing protein [Pyrococcus yayanosii]|uniref:DUF1614 domain-containing protein n=1 Tax=Pyrococcus yayanosii (strain CH1 / JCM 16557) TaxID=529709 RepID=F8AFM3_PYRYC|nr:DUF1614 domain-containing protein [Pyrococcus yayanosii]AEH24989.1 hypothetical protein PYCH_13170 [Pyrococcus yayanosii CH1]
MRRLLFSPLTLPLFILFLILLPILLILFAGTIAGAFSKLGIPSTVAYTLFFASLLGSFINIPVGEIRSLVPVLRIREVTVFGITYPIPYVDVGEGRTVVAVNLGGALIPLSVSLYIIGRAAAEYNVALLLRLALSVVVASLIVHSFSRPVRGMGIAVPFFIPPLTAVSLAMLFDVNRPAVAYISGTLGTLIGADLMNWNKFKELGAPMVSIGGAGTFDGVFLAGIVAVLLV